MEVYFSSLSFHIENEDTALLSSCFLRLGISQHYNICFASGEGSSTVQSSLIQNVRANGKGAAPTLSSQVVQGSLDS